MEAQSRLLVAPYWYEACSAGLIWNSYKRLCQVQETCSSLETIYNHLRPWCTTIWTSLTRQCAVSSVYGCPNVVWTQHSKNFWTMDWLHRSPDINSVNHLWHTMEKSIQWICHMCSAETVWLDISGGFKCIYGLHMSRQVRVVLQTFDSVVVFIFSTFI